MEELLLLAVVTKGLEMVIYPNKGLLFIISK